MSKYSSEKNLAQAFTKRKRVVEKVQIDDRLRLKDDSLMLVQGVEDECIHGVILGHGRKTVPPEDVERINGKFA